MALVITAKIMAGPQGSVNTPPASYIGGIATNIISSVRPYAGAMSGVNAIVNVRYQNGRSLVYKGRYLVNETVTQTITNINT